MEIIPREKWKYIFKYIAAQWVKGLVLLGVFWFLFAIFSIRFIYWLLFTFLCTFLSFIMIITH